jgi:hypothetical protein
VKSVLDRLSSRQLLVTRNWQSFHAEVVEKREVLVRLEQTMAESTKVSAALQTFFLSKRRRDRISLSGLLLVRI